MKQGLLLKMLGKALLLCAAAMLPSLLIALHDHTGDIAAFGIAIAAMGAIGALLQAIREGDENWRARDGFAAVTLCWLALSAFGALPFYLSGYMPNYVDAFFECVSGFTTTGSTVLTDVESLSRALLFWRSFTHWIGGMGVLVLSLAVMPKMGARSINLLRAESTGTNPGKLVPRIGNSARLLYAMYVLLSVVLLICLLFCGMNVYDAAIHTFGAAGTGGFSNYALSVGHFNSPAIDIVLAVFMLLFGVNFTIYYLLFTRSVKQAFKSTELRLYGFVVIFSILLIAVNILPRYDSFASALRCSLFQVSSIITTTGYATADFNLWPTFSKGILVLLMLTGCCAGSTGGGLKLIRVAVLSKTLTRDIRRTARPRDVWVVKIDGRAMSDDACSAVGIFFFAYMLIIALSAFLVSLDNRDFTTTLTAVIACVSNIGPGLGEVGPMGSYEMFSPLSKLILSFDMLAGRLELFPILMFLSRKAWSRY